MMTPQQLVVEAKAQIRETDIGGALKMIAEGARVIDVREEHEFLSGSLPGAVHISRGVLEFKTTEHPSLVDRGAPMLVYCRTGGRSALAVLALQRLGYTGAVSMAGGYVAWVAHHEPVVEDKTNYGG